MLLCGEREVWWWLHLPRVTQHYHLASVAAWLSSTGPSHHSLLPHILSVCLFIVNGSPCPGIAPAPSFCTFQGTRVPVRGMYSCSKNCLILIPFRLPQISWFTLSLICFSSDSDSCRDVGIGSLLPPPAKGRSSPTNTPVFLSFLHPAEFWVILCILFCWSGTPVCSQLVFWLHPCVWRCIPDVSVERDALHVYLLLCHLVLWARNFEGSLKCGTQKVLNWQKKSPSKAQRRRMLQNLRMSLDIIKKKITREWRNLEIDISWLRHWIEGGCVGGPLYWASLRQSPSLMIH